MLALLIDEELGIWYWEFGPLRRLIPNSLLLIPFTGPEKLDFGIGNLVP